MKTTKYTDTYGAVGMCLGVAFGCWTDQLAVGIMFGLAIGICVGNRKVIRYIYKKTIRLRR